MSWQWFGLRFPSELDADSVLRFTRNLAVRPRRGLLMRADPVVCEVEARNGRLRWRLGVTDRDAAQVLGALRLALPGLRTEAIDAARPVLDRAWELRLNDHQRPLRTDVPAPVAGALLGALLDADRGETVVLQWVIGPWLHRPVVPPATTITHQGDGFDLGRLVLNSEETRALRDKYKEPLLGVVARIGVQVSSSQRAARLRQAVMGALQLVRSPGVGLERRLLPTGWAASRLRRIHTPTIAWPVQLNPNELVSCLGWPVGNPVLQGVSYGGSRQLPPPASALVPATNSDPKLRITGTATFPGQEGGLQLSVEDGLRHLHLVGGTGTGKSTLIANLAVADIAAGRSVVVVDPKRDLVRAIADRIPPQRRADVVWLDPNDEYPVGLNVLDGASPEQVADNVVHVLHELYAAHWGPRTADILFNGVLSLARIGGLTFCELPPLLLNPALRRSIVNRLRDDVLGVAPFWTWFEHLSEPERASVVAPVLNKVRSFTQHPAIRGVIGQSHGFDLTQLFTGRKVLLVSLAKDEIGGEATRLFGSLLVSRLWATVQRRSAMPPGRRHQVFVYLDEFGEVMRLPLDFGDALAEARGLGVGLVLAHQSLAAQLPPTTKAAVLAHPRSRIVFQTGYDDAVVLARALGAGLSAGDIQQLDTFDTYQALCVGGRTTSPASVRTRPLPDSLGSYAEVLAGSRTRWGQPRAAVDAELLRRRTVEGLSDGPIGSRQRGGRA
jgi:hypothetical protein